MPLTAPPLNQDGSPQLSVSQRRSQIDECRFVDIRHLVYMVYKKPDQSPLLQYEETLGENRDGVKLTVLNYELNAGWLIRDGTENQGLPVTQPQPAVPPGVQHMSNTPPFNPPQNGAPQQQFAPPQQQQMFAPPQGGPPPQQFAPPQQTFAPPQQQFQAPPQQMMQPPPVASPQQAAAPQQQEQPAAPPTGRKRKGAAVAPPPAAGAPIPQQQPPMQQFQQPPAPQFQPQGQAPIQQFQPQAPQGFAPQAPQQFSAPAPQQQAPASQAQAVDLNPVLARLDGIAGLIQAQAKELAESKALSLKLLAVLHHMYLVNPNLQPPAGAPPVPRTLPEFATFLTQFIGTP